MKNESISLQLTKAKESQFLYQTTLENITELVECEKIPEWIIDSITELLDTENWEELNNRFYKNLAFGTGGMRGRTIGNYITKAERGKTKGKETPSFAAVGSNTLNEITVLRATKALFLHITKWLAEEGILAQPRLIVAHDVRHFSRKFCELAASAWTKLGGYALVFEGARSTPQLSFTVRHQYAHAGVVITASHNPSHDNGFKAYFADGSQLVPPHAEEVVSRYQSISVSELLPLLSTPTDEKNWNILPTEDDLAYRAALEDSVLDPEILKDHAPKLVFTPIHGTGSISAIPALWDHGVEVAVVDEQNQQDPNFSTVDSPNPENPEALKRGISVAQKTKSDLVLASDPDCDRIGVAVRKSSGVYECLTGNQVAVMLAEYRLIVARRKKIITDEGPNQVAILKTFVTTPMISRIAEAFGVKCINTPTGFKWMAEKLGKYEDQAITEIKEKEGLSIDFDGTDLFARIDILTRYSTYVILSVEESYGYLPLDVVRDKDGNASALAIAELFAFLKSSKTEPLQFLDNLYKKYGYHEEKTENLYFEGAEGSKTIKTLAASYRTKKLKEVSGIAVIKSKDFLEKGYIDEDEDELSIENFLMLELENGFTIAIRPSGTEPKIKYYLFGCGEKNALDLDDSKKQVSSKMKEISEWLVEDANKRIG
ncbi:MAG: phospho-sugar mutase [Opitutales bacterium]|nr:phospho-sugar mutase [Opitutales bacterium]MDG1326238.1 phospho-sugar mutase [Opitutales bacterium]